MTSKTPTIAIIGAGPAGCMIARLLHRANIDTTVFEGETSPNYRSQGGTLDLHSETGLLAVKEAGLWDEFLKHARYDGQYMALVDKNNTQLLVKKGAVRMGNKVQERPEIDRARLREMLVESLPEGTIKWGHHLKRVEEDNTLVFEHTTISGFDLIIGADGAWSKVRKMLAPNVEPKYTGIGLYQLNIPDAATTAPAVSELVHGGLVLAGADGMRLTIQQMGDGNINVYAAFLKDSEDWMAPEKCGYDSHDLAVVQEALLVEHQGWSPELVEAISKSSGLCIPKSLYMLPVGSNWTHKTGATAIGDAAHLMTPFAGEGVNVALEDALKLSKVIIAAVEKGGSASLLDQSIESFEKEMFPRMEKVQRLTDELAHDYLFTPGAPRTTLATSMTRHVKYHTPSFFHPLATVVVHSYFFMRNLRQ